MILLIFSDVMHVHVYVLVCILSGQGVLLRTLPVHGKNMVCIVLNIVKHHDVYMYTNDALITPLWCAPIHVCIKLACLWCMPMMLF